MVNTDLQYSWDTFPKWRDSDTETMKDILAWVVRHKTELREKLKEVEEFKKTYNIKDWPEPYAFIKKELLGE